MSVNLYLNKKVLEHKGIKKEPYKNSSDIQVTLNGMTVFGDKGRLCVMWSEDAVIPDELKDVVEEISCYEDIPQMSHRESGIYRHGSAECELTPKDLGSAKRERPVYWLKIIAKKSEDNQDLLRDIKELMHKIKTGTIRPDESYEGHQQGKSKAELEKEVEELRAAIQQQKSDRDDPNSDLNLYKRCNESRKQECRRIVLVYSLMHDLQEGHSGSWSWSWNSDIVEKIRLALL